MATKTIETVLDTVPLPEDGTERIKDFYKRRDELSSKTEVDLKGLKSKVEGLDSLDAKIVTLIVQISGVEAAKGTKAWNNLSTDQRHLFEEHGHGGAHSHDVPHRHDGKLEGGIDNEITTLKGEIATLLGKSSIKNVEGSARILQEYSRKLDQPGLGRPAIDAIRKSLNQMQAAVDGFAAKNAQDIIDKIQRYNESTVEKTDEANMLLYGAIVHELYSLGFRLSFGRSNKITVTGSNETEAANLATTFAGKPTVIEWLKRGLVINTSKWTDYMNSYPSKSTATVEKYISTYGGKDGFSDDPMDVDFLSSATSGGFDIKGEGDRWVTRGMSIYNIAESAQQAAKKWKEMGYQTPMQKSGGRAVQFAEVAYNVAKFGFAAASVWKGTKALWKTVFGDEAGMKAAWGEFGKTLAWTGAVWYGGEAVKSLVNDVKASIDTPNYPDSLKRLSTQPEKSGLYDGFVAMWNKVGKGYMPGQTTFDSLALGALTDRVPAHQFKEMWEILCTGNQGQDFLNVSINDLSRALDNSYHTSTGSHVGGIREFFTDMGPWGKDVYDKFFIDHKTGDAAQKFLRAIADYRSENSFDGARDAVGREQPISALFASPLARKEETPSDFDPEIKELKDSIKDAGGTIVKSGLKLGKLGAEGVRVVFEGINGAFDMTVDTLKNLTPDELGVLKGALAVLGLTAAGAGVVYGISLIPTLGVLGGTAKILAITGIVGAGGYGIYKLVDATRGLINDPDKLVDFIKDKIPTLKAPIEALEAMGYTGSRLLEELKKSISGMSGIPDWVKKSIDSMLTPSPTVPTTPPGAPPPPATPGYAPAPKL